MLKSFNQILVTLGSCLKTPFLLFLRLFFGLAFLMAGLSKLQNIPAIASFFGEINIPFPLINAYIASFIEFFGGIFLLVGFGSRLASLLLCIVMIVAAYTAHHDAFVNVLNDPQAFIVLAPVVFFLACFTIFIFGPGKASIDYFLGIEETKE